MSTVTSAADNGVSWYGPDTEPERSPDRLRADAVRQAPTVGQGSRR